MTLRTDFQALPAEVFAELDDVPQSFTYSVLTPGAYTPGGEIALTQADATVTGVIIAHTAGETGQSSIERETLQVLFDGAQLPAGAPHVNARILRGGVEYEITAWETDPVNAAPILSLTRAG